MDRIAFLAISRSAPMAWLTSTKKILDSIALDILVGSTFEWIICFRFLLSRKFFFFFFFLLFLFSNAPPRAEFPVEKTVGVD